MLIRWLVGLAALGATVVLVAACDDRQYRSSTHVADTGDTPGGEDTGDTSPDGPDDATDQDTQSQDTPPFDLGDDTDPPPPGGVTLVMHNVGELPVYLEPLFPDTAYLGVQILTTQGEVLPLSLGCRTTCDECKPIQCEPPEPRVRQLLPGDTLPFDWDGTYFEETQCTDVEAVACRTRRVAARGEYVARVCWTTTLETQRDRPPDRRRDDDTLAPAWLRDVECGESRFLLGRDRATHQLVFSPRAVEKQHGYCGRAWTYDNVRFPSFAGGIPRPREGETVAIPLGQEEITAQPCHRLGNVGHFVDEGPVRGAQGWQVAGHPDVRPRDRHGRGRPGRARGVERCDRDLWRPRAEPAVHRGIMPGLPGLSRHTDGRSGRLVFGRLPMPAGRGLRGGHLHQVLPKRPGLSGRPDLHPRRPGLARWRRAQVPASRR